MVCGALALTSTFLSVDTNAARKPNRFILSNVVPHARKDTTMFESPYIKINEHGIDLIKNYQVDKHIDYREINSIIFKNGHLLNNWILSLVLSILLTGFSLLWGLKSYITFDFHNIPPYDRMYIAFRLIMPWLFLIGGSIWIYLATKHSPVISIKTNHKNYKIALKEFKESDNLNDLIDFLAERVELIRKYND